jgi:hypothetical protein
MGEWIDGGPREDKTAVHALPAEGGAAVNCDRPTMGGERESSSFLGFLFGLLPSAKDLLCIR